MYKTKEEAILHLMKNSWYDSDWVNIAADLLSQPMLNVDGSLGEFKEIDLARLNAKQLSIVSDAVTANKNLKDSGVERLIPIKDMIFAGLNATQMEILKIAFAKEELSEEQHYILRGMIDKNISYAKLNFLVRGVVDGFTEITNYHDDFDAAQLAEIYSGWKDEIDYKIYAKPKISGDDMALLRHALVIGKHVNVIELDHKELLGPYYKYEIY